LKLQIEKRERQIGNGGLRRKAEGTLEVGGSLRLRLEAKINTIGGKKKNRWRLGNAPLIG
jgi:hypothetical protein